MTSTAMVRAVRISLRRRGCSRADRHLGLSMGMDMVMDQVKFPVTVKLYLKGLNTDQNTAILNRNTSMFHASLTSRHQGPTGATARVRAVAMVMVMALVVGALA
jgi:hypothetical protein